MNKIFISLLCLCCSSCYTQKTARRQVIRAQMQFPAVVADGCAGWYPPKEFTNTTERYIRGRDSIITDTVQVDCADPVNLERIVRVPVVREVYRVDTFENTVIKTVENTARVQTLNREADRWKSLFWLSCGIGGGLFILSLFIHFKKS